MWYLYGILYCEFTKFFDSAKKKKLSTSIIKITLTSLNIANV